MRRGPVVSSPSSATLVETGSGGALSEGVPDWIVSMRSAKSSPVGLDPSLNFFKALFV